MAVKKYTKADIIDALYEKTGMGRKEIRSTVDLLIEEIRDALMRRQVIELRGLGTFEVKVRKARQHARNPRTGEAITIRSHGAATFRAGRDLKQAVWNITDDSKPARKR
ncbi:MAG: HU family DNA-binding protein [Treponema sp.]|jgi:integration host factor subunit beta|nr:HU family DNA-binding protein [Treponema sp.]